jgi:hypothetical protein
MVSGDDFASTGAESERAVNRAFLLFMCLGFARGDRPSNAQTCTPASEAMARAVGSAALAYCLSEK